MDLYIVQLIIQVIMKVSVSKLKSSFLMRNQEILLFVELSHSAKLIDGVTNFVELQLAIRILYIQMLDTTVTGLKKKQVCIHS